MTDDRFKDYVSTLYARPEAGAACLLLQDRCGADVLLMITACYAATTLETPLSSGDIAALSALVAPWRRETVAPLRRVRRHLKSGWPDVDAEARLALRRDLAQLEQRAEWIQATMIADWLAARPQPADPLPLSEALRHLAPAEGPEAEEARETLERAALDVAAATRAGG